MKKQMEKSGANSKQKVNYFIWIIVIVQLCVIGWLVTKELNENKYKIGFVEITKVYDSFQLTKQLNEDFSRMQTAKQAQIDSLKLKIERMELTIEQGDNTQMAEYSKLKEDYASLQDQVNNDNLIVQNKYLEQISTQLNSLVKEYGEKNGYDLILGANGDGSIMHGSESINITEDVIAYINQ